MKVRLGNNQAVGGLSPDDCENHREGVGWARALSKPRVDRVDYTEHSVDREACSGHPRNVLEDVAVACAMDVSWKK